MQTNLLLLCICLLLGCAPTSEEVILPKPIKRLGKVAIATVVVDAKMRSSNVIDTTKIYIKDEGTYTAVVRDSIGISNFESYTPQQNNCVINLISEAVDTLPGPFFHYCKAKQEGDSLSIMFYTSAIDVYYFVLKILILDKRAATTLYFSWIDQEGRNCVIDNNELKIKLDKYPLEKGDIVNGYLHLESVQDCQSSIDTTRQTRLPLDFEGYFRCEVE